MRSSAHRFPPPWTIDGANDACLIVRDHDGHALAYVYFENEPGRRAAAKLLTKDEARRATAPHRHADDEDTPAEPNRRPVAGEFLSA